MIKAETTEFRSWKTLAFPTIGKILLLIRSQTHNCMWHEGENDAPYSISGVD